MESMMKRQLVVPIIVNNDGDGNMQIIDGQHRYEACKRLNLPVYYIVQEGYGLEECHTLNIVSRRYSAENFLEGYVALGKEQYIKFKEFKEKFPFLSIHLCQIYLTGGIRRDKQDAFKNGVFQIANYNEACDWADKANDFRKFAGKFFTNRNFHTALLKLFRSPKYNHEKMMQKLEVKGGELRHHSRERYFVENLCDIYNFKTRDEDRIYPHELVKY
jgi:hypothetical protein